MKRFLVAFVLMATGCGPSKEEANQAASDALVTLGKLRSARQVTVDMSQKELAGFDGRIESAIEKIKEGQESGRAELLATIKERDTIVQKWAADIERRDAVILAQKAAVEEAVMAAGPESYGEVPNLANDATATEQPELSSDVVEIP